MMGRLKCGIRSAECGIYLALIPLTAFAGEEPLPKLLPPRGELVASFWERYGWLTLGIALVLLVIVAIMWLIRLRRVEPPVITAPDVFARRALEALRGRPENGALLVEVSRIVRRYVIIVSSLPPGEMTSTELRVALASRLEVPSELAGAIGDFLRQCDERKFSAAPPPSSIVAVDAALDLVEKFERARREKTVEASSQSQPATVAGPS